MNVESLAGIIANAGTGVSFSGAGLSAASGLPTYRGSDGLWQGADPGRLTERALRADPVAFWSFFREHWLGWRDVRPNAAHQALVQLEQTGRLGGHITQNVDGLLQAAGSLSVTEIHGHLRSLVCMLCDRQHPMEMASEALPSCPCGGLLRPSVTMFGDPLPPGAYQEAVRRMRDADLVLIVGTTLDVNPAASLIKRRHWNTPTVVIDPNPPVVRGAAVHYVRAAAEEILPALVASL